MPILVLTGTINRMAGKKRMLDQLGLGGDGDEIEAIEDVERDFHVKIDTTTAIEWRTVGDVYNALLLVLPDYVKAQPTTWRRFCRALCQVTGDDPEAVGRDTILIGRPWGVIAGIRRLFGR
ncbi:hypothetical protein J4O76_14705 [Sphingomonas sp. NFX23]